MPTSQGDAQRTEMESQIKNNFSELQKRLADLQNEITNESNTTKKQEKQAEFDKMKSDLDEMKKLIDTLSSLQEQDLQALKTRLEQYSQVKQDVQGETTELLTQRTTTPTTYELLKDSGTCNKLRNIIESNPTEFKNVPGDTPEKKVEYIFTKIRNSIVLFMKNKLGDSENTEKIINNTIAPAFEWNLMELLRDQGNEANVSMLQGIDKISFDSFNKLVKGVSKFAQKTIGSYNKFSQWMNALDYLSVHNGVLRQYNKSEVLSNPLKFQEYMNDPRFSANGFSPYASISDNIFKIDESQDFEFGFSLQEKQKVLSEIGNIQVVNNPRTTALIASMLDKPEKFLQKTEGLQKTANSLLDGVNSLNSVTKIFGVDILGDITKAPEKRGFLYRIIDFVCKLIGITGGLEGIVKKWRLDRMNLTDEKNENINQIFKKYKELAGENVSLSITDENSCKTALSDFAVTELDKQSTTKGDYLRDVMAENMDINLISPAIVQQTLGNDYLKKETITVNGKQQEKITIDSSKITEDKKKELVHKHLVNMKVHLENNFNDLKDFYTNIHSVDDIALCITASLYVDKDDVIEGVKAKVFLPENYGTIRSDGTVVESGGRDNLDSTESSNKQVVTEQWVYDKAKEYGITDNRQIAYVLSTIKGESGFKNQKEIGGESKSYGKVDSTTGKAYYGRGFIQITHKSNYQKYTQIIRDSGKDFKDNDGNIISGSEIDLVNNPDIILQSNDLAIFIAMDWMKNGGPGRRESQKLSYYINDSKLDFTNARRIINGTDKAKIFANDAQAYLTKLGNGSPESSPEKSDYLIGPKLLANNKDEIGGLGNSIMNGFQGGNGKLNFPNMDGVVGKNTRNHPNRFNSKDDVLAYKKAHPNIKSFMLYFGANNTNNDQTKLDITQWSTWLKEVGIQPVLCTNIGADKEKTSHLQALNQEILNIGKKNNWPVLDFAKSYSKGDISLSSDGLHPKSYVSMVEIVSGQLG